MRKFLLAIVLLCLFPAMSFAASHGKGGTATTTASGSAGSDPVLLGDTNTESTTDSNGTTPQAWEYTATTSGTATDIEVYDASGTAKTTVGLYSSSGSNPSKLLSSASIAKPKSGAWNDVTIPNVQVTAGTVYWLAIQGDISFKDKGSSAKGCTTVVSSSSISATWKTSQSFSSYCPASFYVNGTTSTPPPPPPPVGPSNTVLPSISGTPQQGDTLTASSGTWTGDSPIVFTYTWSDGTTGNTDKLSAADVGQNISVTVTAENDSAVPVNATSASVGPVQATPPPPPPPPPVGPANTAAPSISGTAQSGDTLTADPGTWTGDTPIAFTYAWSDGASGKTDKLTDSDVGNNVSVTVTASNDGGSANATSASVGPVQAVPPPPPPPPPVAPSNTVLPKITGTAQQGDTLTASQGTWTGDTPISFSYLWSDGTTGSSDTLGASDVGNNVSVTVTASNDGGSAHATSSSVGPVAATPPPPPPPPNSTVGVGGAPSPTCATTVAVNGNVNTAISNAAAGSTVCLASGTWNGISLSGSSKAVTIASATPGGAHVAGITMNSAVSNLTVEGLQMNGGFKLDNNQTNNTYEYNSIENYGNGSGDAQLDAAFYSYPQEAGGSSVSGVTVQYNQMDNLPQCLEINTEGADSSQNDWTFSHNVCGPGIGNDEPNDVHYTQEEGTTNLVMDNNAFIGPHDNVGSSHLNVAHICGSNIKFDGNIVYHTETVGQAFLAGDDCALTGSEANNNLFVEDNTSNTYSMWIDSAHGSSNDTMSNNTIINPTQYGAMLIEIGSFTAHNNLSDSANGFSFSGGTESNNASNDGSGDVNWTPAWLTTTWTPNNGSPWKAPPTGYYQPSVLASTFGYQGTIGP